MLKVIFFDYNGTCTDLRGLDRSWVKTLYTKHYEGDDFISMQYIIPYPAYYGLIQAKPWPDYKAIAGLIQKRVCLTNNSLYMMNSCHYENPFSSVFSSDDARCYKPNPKFYQEAMAAYRVKPEECMLVAAHTFDLKAAKQEGMQTCFITREGEDLKPERRIVLDGFMLPHDYIDVFFDNFYRLGIYLFEQSSIIKGEI